MLVAGLMSGTSVDGIDVALVEIRGAGLRLRVRPLAHSAFPYPPPVRAAILAVSDAACHTRDIARLHVLLGELYAEAVRRACRRAKIPLRRLDLIGCHGQTIYHQGIPKPFLGRRLACTLQIGEPVVIAARAGVDVVADFRPADLAAGGQGAPLVPYVDYLLYRSPRLSRVSLNIGGIANITVIPRAARPQDVVAFDTGPGNMVLDALAAHFSAGRERCDRDGRLAALGRVDRRLLDALLRDPYFRRPPSKSCGREQYGAAFVERLLARCLAPPDLLATATAFTAASIALGVRRFAGSPGELIVSGGGLRNRQLMAQLAAFLPGVRLRPSSDFGIDPDAKEAIAFAVLAYESYHRRPANLPSATGARGPAILGKLALAPSRTERKALTPLAALRPGRGQPLAARAARTLWRRSERTTPPWPRK
ncbi:MAG TPA: anhydro-N-acetylmuramic acid kinase [Bryobacterales bacterium]|nr:anhydro-N-acetylmuramic acid kinase [Bryobacterales bacterium]